MATAIRQIWCAAPPLALWRRVCPCSLFRWFWPMPIGHAIALWLASRCGARRWDPGMGKTNDAAAGTHVNPALRHNRHRRIWSVSLLPQSSLPWPNAPLFRPHLGVQFVVGHCRACRGPYH